MKESRWCFIGEKERIVRLIDDYQRLIFSICYKMTADYFTAEDLTQETFIATYQNLHRFTDTNEKAYIARIATNKSIDYLRNATNRFIPTQDSFFKDQIDRNGQPETLCIADEIQQKMKQCIEKLEPPYNEIATAFYMEEKTAREIADERNQNVKTIQTQIYRAREQLKKFYGGKK